MHFVAVDDQVSDRRFGVGTVYGNAKAVAALSGSIAAFKIVLNVMDVVLQKLDMGAGTDYVDAQRGEAMFGGTEVANLKALDPHITFVLNREYAGSA